MGRKSGRRAIDLVIRTERFTDFEIAPALLARRLLGQRLVHVVGGERRAGIIVETEAYLGVRDRAAHSFGGHRSSRNESMYAEGGHAYVYFIYGMHHCMNVVCGRRDEPVAVLVRALEPTEGTGAMLAAQRGDAALRALCAGPGRLARALGIDRALDGTNLRTSPSLFIERLRRRAVPRSRILVTPRVGVAYAGVWARRPLRFCVADSPHVTRGGR